MLPKIPSQSNCASLGLSIGPWLQNRKKTHVKKFVLLTAIDYKRINASWGSIDFPTIWLDGCHQSKNAFLVPAQLSIMQWVFEETSFYHMLGLAFSGHLCREMNGEELIILQGALMFPEVMEQMNCSWQRCWGFLFSSYFSNFPALDVKINVKVHPRLEVLDNLKVSFLCLAFES